MDKKLVWRIVATVTFAVMLVVNSLAGATTLLNGQNTATVSNTYPTLFTPAGFTFAIWGVIYLLVIGYVVYQLGYFGKVAKDKQKAIDAITPTFTALSVVNTAWIFAWQYNVLWLALLLIVTMLVLLIRINEKLRSLEYTKREFALLRAPFSVYFGWLTVATVANVCVWLVSIKWDAWGVDPVTWLITILWVASVIGVIAVLRNRDWAYGLVFVWAYLGILLNGTSTTPSIIANLAVLIAVFAAACGYVYGHPAPQRKGFLTKLFKR
jgi:hypothetical protein